MTPADVQVLYRSAAAELRAMVERFQAAAHELPAPPNGDPAWGDGSDWCLMYEEEIPPTADYKVRAELSHAAAQGNHCGGCVCSLLEVADSLERDADRMDEQVAVEQWREQQRERFLDRTSRPRPAAVA